MDGRRFDQVVVTMTAGTRRGLLLLLALLVGLFWRPADDSEAGKGTGGRKGGKRHGRNRTRRRDARRRRHQHKKKKPPQAQCSPEAPDDSCEGDQLCIEGVCQPCAVTCDGELAECAVVLQAALDTAPSGPLYVCPGRYVGHYLITAGIALIGAGDGDDPASDTILDGLGTSRVLSIGPGQGEVRLERLRITGGNEGTSGGGISSNNNRDLILRRCTVSGNHAAGDGGGIFNFQGTLALEDCRIEENTAADGGGIFFRSFASCTLTGNTQVRDNEADLQGGGLFVGAGTVTVDAGCRVTANEAPSGQGGGIYKFNASSSTVTLPNDQIVTDNIGGNCAGATIINCDG